ncbi:hypothetical protein ABT299_44390 [Spirillospora sp. NPDC000708]
MSDLNSAIIAYGYDLGGAVTRWKVHEVDASGVLTVPWAQDPDPDDYLEDRMPLDGTAGVSVLRYGDDEDPQSILAAQWVRIGPAEVFDLALLPKPHHYAVWDRRLDKALKLAGLTPLQRHPAWLACSINRSS